MQNETNERTRIEGRRLGKFPARQSRKALLFSDFVKYSRVPTRMSYWRTKPEFPKRTFGNDRMGDCTRAKQAFAAMRMERLEQRGKTIEITDEEIVRVYVDMSNRLYGGGDNGAYEEDALNEWRKPDTTFRDTNGNPYTIDGFLKINHANHDEMRAAMALAQARGIAICLNLPEAYSDLNPPDGVWGVPENGGPLTGRWLPGSWGGHSMWSLGDYDSEYVWLDDTWAFGPRRITWDGLAAYCDEAHMVIDSVDIWRTKKAADATVSLNVKQFVGAVNDVSATKIK
jgi:hypothetical protein